MHVITRARVCYITQSLLTYGLEILSYTGLFRFLSPDSNPAQQHSSNGLVPAEIGPDSNLGHLGRRPAPEDGGPVDPDLDVHSLDLPVLPRLEADPHHVRGHLQRRDPGPDGLAQVAPHRQRHLAHAHRLQLGRQLLDLCRSLNWPRI